MNHTEIVHQSIKPATPRNTIGENTSRSNVNVNLAVACDNSDDEKSDLEFEEKLLVLVGIIFSKTGSTINVWFWKAISSNIALVGDLLLNVCVDGDNDEEGKDEDSYWLLAREILDKIIDDNSETLS